MAFSFFSSWHAACSWFRTCQGSRKPQRNKSGACCNQRQLWHLTAFSAQWHHANKTSFGVSTDSAVSTGSEVGSRGDVGASSMRSGWKDSRGLCEGIKDIGCNVRISGRRKLNGIGRALWRPPLSRQTPHLLVRGRPSYHPGCGAQKASPHLDIPVFTLRDVYKYFGKREMTCLCNAPLDLQSNAIAEPKTKARVIFLTDVNRLCKSGIGVEHWIKMWGLLYWMCWVTPWCEGKQYGLVREKTGNASLKLCSCSSVIN